MSVARRLPILVATGVLAVGFAMAWLGAVPFGDDACSLDGVPEGAGVSSDLSFWPPGATDCTYWAPGGEVTGRSTEVPWRAWTSVVLFALACGLATSLAASARQPLARIAVAAALVVVSGAVNFGFV